MLNLTYLKKSLRNFSDFVEKVEKFSLYWGTKVFKWAWKMNKNFLSNFVDSSQYWKFLKIFENPVLVSYKKVSHSVCPYHFFSETAILLALKFCTRLSNGTGQLTKLFWVDSTFFPHFGPWPPFLAHFGLEKAEKFKMMRLTWKFPLRPILGWGIWIWGHFSLFRPFWTLFWSI